MDKPDLHSQHGLTRNLLLAALPLSIAICLAYLIHPYFVSSANNRTMDVLMLLAPKKEASGGVVIVDIDEASLARYGQWPWSRYRIAQLLSTINASGAASIGLDLILAEPDRCPPEQLQAESDRGAGVPPLKSGTNPLPTENDRYLEQTLARGPYVLGYEFLFGNSPKVGEHCLLHPPGTVWISSSGEMRDLTDFFVAKDVACDRRQLCQAVQRSGFLNAIPDADGLLRRVPLLIRFEDRLYPSLGLAMLMQYEKSGQIEILRGESGALDLRVGGKSIWIDSQGNMTLQFSRGTKAAARVSAADLFDGRVSPDRLKGKLVLVGSSAAGLGPLYRTASKAVSDHAEIHAQVLDDMLTGQSVIRTRRFLAWEALFGMLAAIVAVLAVARLAILPSAAVCGIVLAGCWVGMRLFFQGWGYLLSPLLPTVVMLSNYAVLTIFKSWKIQVAARDRAERALTLLKSSDKSLVEKQRQLEEINQNLEKRISEAVSALREKDRIMILQGRQAAMGEMIGNIAHQWRQPLNTLGLIVQELRLTYGSEEFSKETLDASVRKAMTLIAHMSQTIEGFSNYFKPDKEMRRFSVNRAVAKTLSLIEPSLKNLEIEGVIMAQEEIEILGYENEYSQVLLNILLNCRDAFEASLREGGRLISIALFGENGRSVVTIADNAGGIPEEILDKIFDPYFTTKGPDKGTGIGLYMAKAIIEKNMGGRLTARNRAGGAEFRIEV